MTAPGKEAEVRKVVAEAVAFGKLVMLREILDALHAEGVVFSPRRRSKYVRGYKRAVRVVEGMRLGVEK